jgi:hemoglobin
VRNEGCGAQQATPYELLGGEAKLRALVDRFYDLMDATPEYFAIRKLHAADLAAARTKLFMFLSGWLGGPNLYIERHGHPRLRMRHFPFSIGTLERDQWIACMTQAAADVGIAEPLRSGLLDALFQTADHLRNRPD